MATPSAGQASGRCFLGRLEPCPPRQNPGQQNNEENPAAKENPPKRAKWAAVWAHCDHRQDAASGRRSQLLQPGSGFIRLK